MLKVDLPFFRNGPSSSKPNTTKTTTTTEDTKGIMGGASKNVNGSKRQVSFQDEEAAYFTVPLKTDGTEAGGSGSSNNSSKNGSAATTTPPASAIKPFINLSERSNASVESVHSNGSKESIATALSRESVGGVSLPSLQQALMRTKKNRDPLKYYEILKVLGDGSMGSVSKVKKRSSALGGSARKKFVEEETKDKLKLGFFPCFTLFCFPGRKRNESAGSNSSFVDVMTATDNSNGGSSAISGVTMDASSSGTADSRQRRPSKEDRIKGFKKRQSSMVTYGNESTVVYALKSIIMERVSDPVFKKELLNEISILRSLDHPNVVKAVETYDYHNRMYLVLELCSGGDLYARDPYDENQAKGIVASILDAVAYLHSKNITHRDLKYENIMFASPTSPTVKIIDFGLSKKYGNSAELMHETVGTVYTMAPEVIKGDYDEKCDVWSIGVIAFMLLSSSLPFYGKTRGHVVRRILEGKYAFKGRRWKEISEEAKSFLDTLLVQDAEKRPSAANSLQHEWLRKDFAHDGNNVSTAIMDQVQACIHTFAGYTKMKKLALLVISYRSTDDEIGFLRRLFQQRFDQIKDGVINYPEFREALKVYDYTDEELVSMFTGIDIDGTGTVSYSEFLAATIETHGAIDESRIAEAFDRIDGDDTGYITVQNLKFMLGQDVSEDYIDDIINEVDLTLDHRIDYQEFLCLWDDDSDEKLRVALGEVKRRRMERESVSDIKTSSTPSFVEYDLDTSEDNQSAVSRDSEQLGGGNFFFDKEKGKSARGVWI